MDLSEGAGLAVGNLLGIPTAALPMLLALAYISAAEAQTEAPPPCRTPTTTEELSLAAATTNALASLDAFVVDLEKRLAEFESALAEPNAAAEVVELYRQMRLQLDEAEAQRAKFATLESAWCDD